MKEKREVPLWLKGRQIGHIEVEIDSEDPAFSNKITVGAAMILDREIIDMYFPPPRPLFPPGQFEAVTMSEDPNG